MERVELASVKTYGNNRLCGDQGLTQSFGYVYIIMLAHQMLKILWKLMHLELFFHLGKLGLEGFDFLLHLVDKGVAFFATCGEEADVVLVCFDLLLELLVDALEALLVIASYFLYLLES